MKKVKVYMKSGNLVKFNADELNIKRDSSGKVKEIEWRNPINTNNGYLVTIDTSNIEAIVVDFTGKDAKNKTLANTLK